MRKFTLMFAFAVCSHYASAGPLPAVNIAATDGGTTANSEQQLDDIAGDYMLPDGRKVRLAAENDRLYADLTLHHRKELQPAGENAFASRDGSIRVTFKPQESGNQIVLNYDSNVHNGRIGISRTAR